MNEMYSVGIRVSLVNAVSAGLLGIAGDFRRADVAAAAFQRRLDGIKAGFLASGIQIAAGLGILAAFKPAIDQAKQFQIETTKFATQFGMGDAATAQAAKFAKAMNVMGVSYVDAMRLINESQGVFRESGAMTFAQQFEGARIAAPILGKLHFIEKALYGATGDNPSEDVALLRFAEQRGAANDPRRFQALTDFAFKLSKSSGGLVNFEALRQFGAQTGPLIQTLTDRGMAALEPIMADLGGGRTGSGLRTSFYGVGGLQRMIARQRVAELLKLGLWDASKVELSSGGTVKQFLGAPGDVFKGRLQFMADPAKYYTDTFLPALAKRYSPEIAYGKTEDDISRRAFEIGLVFGPGTAGQVFTQVDKLLPAIQRSLGAQQAAMGVNAAYGKAGNTLQGRELAVAAQFKDVLEAVGEAALPIVTRAMQALLPPLQAISAFATDHPRLFGYLVDGLIGLGVALTVSGVIIGLSTLASFVGLVGGAFASASWLSLAAGISKLPIVGAAAGDAMLGLGAAIESGAAVEAAAAVPIIGSALAQVAAGLTGLAGVGFGTIVSGVAAVVAAMIGIPSAFIAISKALGLITDKQLADKNFQRGREWSPALAPLPAYDPTARPKTGPVLNRFRRPDVDPFAGVSDWISQASQAYVDQFAAADKRLGEAWRAWQAWGRVSDTPARENFRRPGQQTDQLAVVSVWLQSAWKATETALGKIGKTAGDDWTAALEAFMTPIDGFVSWLGGVAGRFKALLPSWAWPAPPPVPAVAHPAAVSGWLTSAWTTAETMFGKIGQTAADNVTAAFNAVMAPINSFATWLGKISAQLKALLPTWRWPVPPMPPKGATGVATSPQLSRFQHTVTPSAPLIAVGRGMTTAGHNRFGREAMPPTRALDLGGVIKAIESPFSTAVNKTFAALAPTKLTVAVAGWLKALGDNRTTVDHLSDSHRALAKAEIGGAGTILAAMANFASQAEALAKALGRSAAATAMPQPQGAHPIQVHTSVHLDGKTIANVVSNHQGHALSGPRNSWSGHDPSVSLPPSHLSYQQ